MATIAPYDPEVEAGIGARKAVAGTLAAVPGVLKNAALGVMNTVGGVGEKVAAPFVSAAKFASGAMGYGDNMAPAPMPAAAPTVPPVTAGNSPDADRSANIAAAQQTKPIPAPAAPVEPAAPAVSTNETPYGNTTIAASSSVPGARPDTFVGGTAQTPEQAAAEQARWNAGKAASADLINQMNASTARINEVTGSKASDFNTADDTIAGRIARQGAMQAAGVRMRQMEPGFKQAEIGVRQREAETQAANVASEAGLRGITGQETQQKIAMQQQTLDLQHKIQDPNTAPEERIQLQRILARRLGAPEFEQNYEYNELGQKVPTGGAFSKYTGLTTFPEGKGPGKAAPPANHVAALKANPSLATHYDAMYGKGSAANILGQ